MKRLAFSSIFIVLSLLLLATLGCGDKKYAGTQPAASVATAQKNAAVPLAEGFPKDFPIIKGIVTSSMKNAVTDAKNGNQVGTGYYTQIKTDLTVKQAMDFYKPKFSKIVKQESAKQGKPAMYSGYISGRAVTIYFIDQKDKTMVSIVLSASKK